MRIRRLIPGVDAKLLIKDAGKLLPDPLRRNFLRGAASLGALTFLTGCDIIDGDAAEGVLRKISAFNDGAQAALFSRTKLAPTYPESAITKPFPFNGYYDEDEAPDRLVTLDVTGLPIMRQWHVVHLKDRKMMPAAETVSRFLTEEAATYLPALTPHWFVKRAAVPPPY